MGKEVNGLALQVQGLAQRLEALERENGRMRSENAELRDEVAALKGSGTRRDGPAETRSLIPHREGQRGSGYEGQVSRRWLLTKAGAAAVAAMAAGTLIYPREARADTFEGVYSFSYVIADTFVHGADGVSGWRNSDSEAAVYGKNRGSAPAVEGKAEGDGGIGVKGTSTAFNPGPGVRGDGVIGVWGTSSTGGQAGVYGAHDGLGPGVVGDGTGGNYAGVLGRNGSGHGVRGESRAQQGNFSGVLGTATSDGIGVRGTGGTGMWGSSSKTGYPGVYGQHTGSAGYGVVGNGTGSNGAGVLGRNSGGYGGQFEGGKAQLWIKPKPATGEPKTGAHLKGEISMDFEATLWVCTASGTPGTWRKVATTAN